MTTETETTGVTPKRHGPLDRDFWHGYLTIENHADVAERLRRMLEGKRYTFVSIYDGRPALNDVRTSQKLTDPIRVTHRDERDDGWAYIGFSDSHYAWSISTSAMSESEAHENRKAKRSDWTGLSFSNDYRGERVVIEQVNGYGEPLQWIVQVEDHSEATR